MMPEQRQQTRPREDAQTVYVQGTRYTKLECVGRGGSSKVFKVSGRMLNLACCAAPAKYGLQFLTLQCALAQLDTLPLCCLVLFVLPCVGCKCLLSCMGVWPLTALRAAAAAAGDGPQLQDLRAEAHPAGWA
jgi:hypothetical protein